MEYGRLSRVSIPLHPLHYAFDSLLDGYLLIAYFILFYPLCVVLSFSPGSLFFLKSAPSTCLGSHLIQSVTCSQLK